MIFYDYFKNIFFQNIKIKLNLRTWLTWMTLKSSVVIFQALEPLQPHWPLQPQKPYFTKELPDPDDGIIPGTKIQLTLDPFAVISYIVNYVNKDESGLTKFMKEALTQVASSDAKEKLKALKTAYLSHHQIGASEAVYRINPDMKLKDSSITCFRFPQKLISLLQKSS